MQAAQQKSWPEGVRGNSQMERLADSMAAVQPAQRASVCYCVFDAVIRRRTPGVARCGPLYVGMTHVHTCRSCSSGKGRRMALYADHAAASAVGDSPGSVWSTAGLHMTQYSFEDLPLLF
ncbi:unnamed protein product [Boreogadus saida]